jgi:peptidoglycan/xylan/chitin deacetylase (PgdA/CDA1 family)
MDFAQWIRDRWRVRRWSRPADDEAGVVIFLFHSLFRSAREAASGVCDPQQAITIDFFREFVESLLANGTPIRSLEDAISAPRPGLTAVITFDDGYFNNTHALPVLEASGITATFFISTSHVEQGKSFWWDALYRNARRRGTGRGAIARQIQSMKTLTNDAIEARLVESYGRDALKPVTDYDRPFTPAELAEFAASSSVDLGNHTSDHAILTNYGPDGARTQIVGAQRYLASLTGAAPKAIAYPNGNYDVGVERLARESGLAIGVTVRAGVNRVPASSPFELQRLTVRRVPSASRQAGVFASMNRLVG